VALELADPNLRWRGSFLEALAEFHAEGRYGYLDAAALALDFGGFVERVRRGELRDPRLPPTSNPLLTLWLVDGEVYLGRVNFRPELDEWQRTHAGHIGYDLRPSARGRGLGHLALRLALDYARDRLRLPRALLICNPTNLASEKAISAAGGVFSGEFVFEDWPRPLRHFWIDLRKT